MERKNATVRSRTRAKYTEGGEKAHRVSSSAGGRRHHNIPYVLPLHHGANFLLEVCGINWLIYRVAAKTKKRAYKSSNLGRKAS